MSRRFILKDDRTDHNGVVLDGIAGSSFDGRPLAYLGALRCVTRATSKASSSLMARLTT
jgi:hypothetical protein